MYKRSKILLLLTGLGIIGSCQSHNRSSRVHADSPVIAPFPQRPTSDLNVVAKIDVSGDWMCFANNSLWELSRGKIVRVDPVTHLVVATVDASGNFCEGSPNGDALWVLDVNGKKIRRVDTNTNAVTATYTAQIDGGTEGSFTVTDNGVWMITSNGGTAAGTLTRLNPETGEVLADIKIANDSHGMVNLGGFVWVTNSATNTVTQVSVETNAIVQVIPVEARPRFIAAGENAVWALCQGMGHVVRINPTTGQVMATIDAKSQGGGGDIAAGGGSVWVTMFGKPVTQIDPATNTVTQQFIGSGFGDAIRVGGGFVWVSGSKLSQLQFL